MKITLLVNVLLVIMLTWNRTSQAESTKFVQWWDKYSIFGVAYRSKSPNSMQYQDVNKDNVYDDTVVWYPFSLTEALNPTTRSPYKIQRPSATFYGGMIGRYTNASHLLREDGSHIFSNFSQSTVQFFESSVMCTYSTRYTEHTGHIWNCPEKDVGKSKVCWGDMTLMIVGGQNLVTATYEENQDIDVNFSALFIWKKQDFINGGDRVDKITFDETSKLSIDMTGRTSNVEEVRFIVQDGEQLWMSEATAVANETGKTLRKGNYGMEINDFGGNFYIKLVPKNSRWAVYQPMANDKEVNRLTKKLKDFTSSGSAKSDKTYQEDSQRFLQEVNKMEFNSQEANFVEHHFENVQAVGVYTANYQFFRPTNGRLWLAFDNFQLYATGSVPERNAVASTPQGGKISTKTTSKGGISINCGPVEQTVRQCSCDRVDIQGELTVDDAHVGQTADIIVYAIYKDSPESEKGIFYMLDKNHVPHQWDEEPKTLVAFQEGVTLQPKHPVSIYSGSFALDGFLQIFFGYRLPEGTLVISQNSIDTHIFPVLDHKNNEKPYCEAIKEQCSSNP